MSDGELAEQLRKRLQTKSERLDPATILERLKADSATLRKEREELVLRNMLLTERLGFIRTVTAILLFIAVWKVTVALGCRTWIGGSTMAALMVLYPTVFEPSSYRWTRGFSPTAGRLIIWTVVIVIDVIANALAILLKIPQ
jgi:uncharacterized membrane protein YkgB